MKWFTNIFSGRTYYETDNTIQRDDGQMFYKSGSQYIGDHGEIIQKQDDNYMNLNTGTQSTWGDPFAEDK